MVDKYKEAGSGNLNRAKKRLLKNKSVINWLYEYTGLSIDSIDKFHLGLAEPFKIDKIKTCTDALSIPVIGNDGKPKRRRLYYNVPGITINPKDRKLWGWGKSLVYYSDNSINKKKVFVCGDLFDVWRFSQFCAKTKLAADFLFIANTDPELIPKEFRNPIYWSQFEEIYFGHSADKIGNSAAESLRKLCFSNVKRVLLPEGVASWRDFIKQCEHIQQFAELLDDAVPMSSSHAIEALGALQFAVGEFAVHPVNCNGAFSNGYMYYPYRVERREMERIKHRDGSVTETLVSSYRTKVVRSDGTVLDIEFLPAPRGTAVAERVLALSDGTRIDHVPNPNLYATWHLESINKFIRSKQSGESEHHRSLDEILFDLIQHFRRAVWLPFEEDYVVLSLYTIMSFVYDVFEAVPLILVCGPKGSGKTELGTAVAQVAFNSQTIGQGSAASTIRVLHESRGLIVLDDLEGIKTPDEKQAFNEIHQVLKLSYKKKTSRKAITDKSGKTIMLDFFGPKVINNTRGVDAILESRMITIQTRKLPSEFRSRWNLSGSDPEFTFALRNELHVWGMNCSATIYEQYKSQFPYSTSDRKDEIFLPLMIIASFSADNKIIDLLYRKSEQLGVEKIETFDTKVLLDEAIKSSICLGYSDEVALPFLQLQIALIIENNLNRSKYFGIEPLWKQPQWIGNMMESYNLREKNTSVRRARLHGRETRIYKLSRKYVLSIINSPTEDEQFEAKKPPSSVFKFCETVPCSSCSFVNICDDTVPGLKSAKNKRYRTSKFTD